MNTQTHSVPFLISVLFLSSLTGCGGGSNGDPVISTPTPTLTATVTELTISTGYCFVVSAYNGLSGAPSNEVSAVTSPSGTTVSLTWGAVQDPTVSAYDVHYGKQSLGLPGDCTYSNSMRVPAVPS